MKGLTHALATWGMRKWGGIGDLLIYWRGKTREVSSRISTPELCFRLAGLRCPLDTWREPIGRWIRVWSLADTSQLKILQLCDMYPVLLNCGMGWDFWERRKRRGPRTESWGMPYFFGETSFQLRWFIYSQLSCHHCAKGDDEDAHRRPHEDRCCVCLVHCFMSVPRWMQFSVNIYWINETFDCPHFRRPEAS